MPNCGIVSKFKIYQYHILYEVLRRKYTPKRSLKNISTTTRSHRLTVRTPDSQSGNRSSILRGITITRASPYVRSLLWWACVASIELGVR